MKINTLFVFTFSVVQTINCFAQSPDNILDKHLQKIYSQSNFPGFAISIINKDSTLFAKSYGYADKVKKIPYS